MIKIALKHWIYEKCIDVFFETITKNFFFSYKQNEFKPGNKFASIVIKLSDPFTLYHEVPSQERWEEPYVIIYRCTICLKEKLPNTPSKNKW